MIGQKRKIIAAVLGMVIVVSVPTMTMAETELEDSLVDVVVAEDSLVGTVVAPSVTSDWGPCIISDNWNAFKLLTNGYLVSAASAEKNYLYAMQSNTISVSDDGGSTFRILAEFEQPSIDSVHVLDEILYVCTSNGRYSAEADAQLFRSDDYGETFTKVLDVDAGSIYEWNMDVASDGTLYASEYGYKSLPNNASKIYKSVDQGCTWVEIYDLQEKDNGHFHRLCVDDLDPNVVYQSVGDGFNNKLMKTTDAGATWQTVIPGFNPTAVVQVADRYIWGADTHPANGLYVMENDEIVDSLRFQAPYGGSVYDMIYVNDMVFAATMSYQWASQTWNSVMWYSKDNGDSWEILGEFEKIAEGGIGIYEMTAIGNTIYLNAGINMQNGLTSKKESFRGTMILDTELIK